MIKVFVSHQSQIFLPATRCGKNLQKNNWRSKQLCARATALFEEETRAKLEIRKCKCRETGPCNRNTFCVSVTGHAGPTLLESVIRGAAQQRWCVAYPRTRDFCLPQNRIIRRKAPRYIQQEQKRKLFARSHVWILKEINETKWNKSFVGAYIWIYFEHLIPGLQIIKIIYYKQNYSKVSL